MAAAEGCDDVHGSGADGGCEGLAFVRELQVGAKAREEGERGRLGFGGSWGGGGRGRDRACLSSVSQKKNITVYFLYKGGGFQGLGEI